MESFTRDNNHTASDPKCIKLEPDSSKNWSDVYKMFAMLNKPDDQKENLHMLTEKIEKRYYSSLRALQEKDDELKKMSEDRAELARAKSILLNQMVSQDMEIKHLKLELEKQKWRNSDMGLSVTKMKNAVIDIHSSFGQMINSLRVSNSSLGQLRQQQNPVERTQAVEDLQYLQSEIDKLFGKLRGKLERWERNQYEMQDELLQTKEVLDKFFVKLMAEKASRQAPPPPPPPPASMTDTIPPKASPIGPLYIHKTIFSPERFKFAQPPFSSHQQQQANLQTQTFVQAAASNYQNRMASTVPPSSSVVRTTQSASVPESREVVYTPKVVKSSPVVMEEERQSVHQHPAVPAPIPLVPVSVHAEGVHVLRPVQRSPTESVHVMMAMYSCPDCEESFSSLVQLRLHSKLKHKELMNSPTTEQSRLQDSYMQSSSSPPGIKSNFVLPKKRKFPFDGNEIINL